MVVSGTLMTGQFLMGYALLVGAKNFEIGLLASVAMWAGLGSLLAPPIIERWRSNKGPTLLFLGTGRSGWLLAVIPALLGYGREPWMLWLLIAASGFFSLSGSMVYPGALSWLKGLVPSDIRGRYFARQNVIANLVAIAALQAGGRFLDSWKGAFGKGSPHGFVICYAAGILIASLGLNIRRKVPEARFSKEEARPSVRKLMLLPLGDPAFRRYVLFYGWYYFSFSIVAPFTMVYMLKHLNISYSTIALLTNVSTISALLSARIWGRLIDKFTPKPVLTLCYPFLCLLPPMWILATPNNYGILYLLNLIGGVAGTGFALGLTNTIMRLAPKEHGSAYYAAENSIISVCGAIGPLLGGWLAQSMEGVEGQIWGMKLYNLHYVFLAGTAVRLGGIFLLKRIRQPREKEVRHMLRVIRRVPALRPATATWDAAHAIITVLRPVLNRGRFWRPRAIVEEPGGEEETTPEEEKKARAGTSPAPTRPDQGPGASAGH